VEPKDYARLIRKLHEQVPSNPDKSQRSERYTSASFLANSEIPTFLDARHTLAHNKIMITDQSTVITGSFNFTKAAEDKNAENPLIIKSKELAGIYIGN
jgi:phosphatidylserine/phosphatidylglycerophosphate/cardiolipin synthase-like enzyme